LTHEDDEVPPLLDNFLVFTLGDLHLRDAECRLPLLAFASYFGAEMVNEEVVITISVAIMDH
jgi:hypothetical protein